MLLCSSLPISSAIYTAPILKPRFIELKPRTICTICTEKEPFQTEETDLETETHLGIIVENSNYQHDMLVQFGNMGQVNFPYLSRR
jgi:hypothetical protein